MAPASPRVAVVGAGMAGLIFARVAQRHGIEVKLYEADTTPESRTQGGMLDIGADSGQAALEIAGLSTQFQSLIEPGGEQVRILHRTGRELYAGEPSAAGENPEVERGRLRNLLLNSLAPGTIRWGAKVVEVHGGDQRRLTFADGSAAHADLIVGADGAWSKVRPLLTRRKPRYSGVTLVETQLASRDASREVLSTLGSGSMFALGERRALLAHAGASRWLAAGFHAPENWAATVGINWADAPSAREALTWQFASWAPELQAALAATRGPVTPRPIYAYPLGMRWRHRPGLTLVGDAAHVMSPFGGFGANLALQDGATLASAIAAEPGNWRHAVKVAEADMQRRVRKYALLSSTSLGLFFGPKAAEQLAFSFRSLNSGALARARRLQRAVVSAAYLGVAAALASGPNGVLDYSA